jgi:hypothetical protein
MHDTGYVPYTNLVLHDVEEEKKVHHLCHHSEKLAIAFGFINTAPGTPLQIRKNLQVCENCHMSTKFISKIAFITLNIVFVLAWTIGDATRLPCQSLHVSSLCLQ